MEISVSDCNNSCTTLHLYGFRDERAQSPRSFEAFLTELDRAISAFDIQESDWHFEEYEDYEYSVWQHAWFYASLLSDYQTGDIKHMEKLGFNCPFPPQGSDKMKNLVTLLVCPVDTLLANMKKFKEKA